MKLLNTLLEKPLVYNAWANTTLIAKMNAIKSIMPPIKGKNVLDIGCGPAMNTALFMNCDYTGIDINPGYIAQAKKKFPDKYFYEQDVTNLTVPEKRFDIILFNSMIHHIPDDKMINIFSKVHSLLNHNGFAILSEPLIPQPHDYICLWAMQLDRGKYFRTREGYHRLFNRYFTIDEEMTYPLSIIGITGWRMYNMRLRKTQININ